VTSESGLFETGWRFSGNFLLMQNIKMIYAFEQSYLTQVVPDEKSGIVRYKSCLFIKVFTMMADR
jgi:hypothetical protein